MPGIKNRNKILISSLSMLLINLVIIFVFGTNLFEEIVYKTLVFRIYLNIMLINSNSYKAF